MPRGLADRAKNASVCFPESAESNAAEACELELVLVARKRGCWNEATVRRYIPEVATGLSFD